MLSLLYPQSLVNLCLQPELLSAWVSGCGEGHSLLKKKKKKGEMLHLSGVNPRCFAIVSQSWCESN